MMTTQAEQDSLADMDMSNSPASSSSATPATTSTEIPVISCALPAASWFYSSEFGMVPQTSPFLMLANFGVQYENAYGNAATATSSVGMPVANVGNKNSLQKEIVRLKQAVLYPPNPNAPVPQVRPRPPGCRTVFVGGLPEKCTEDIMRELLGCCGEIQSVRMSKKNFAHVRFTERESVDKALYFSGYRMKVDDRSDKEFTGRIHIDYAQARDDFNEWEREQRALEREQRHRERSTSPTTSNRFNENDAADILEKLKDGETFATASDDLMNWLDNGDCNKKTSTVFYSMIAAVNGHVRRLSQERLQHEIDLRTAVENHHQRLQNVIEQLGQIEKVFHLARKQKNWDHFSRAQRKNVDIWLKQTEETRKANEDAMLRDRHEVEMETSDDDDDDENEDDHSRAKSYPNKKAKFDPSFFYEHQAEELRAENSRLKTQLDDLQIKLANSEATIATGSDNDACTKKNAVSSTSAETSARSADDARLISLMSCFLNVHPSGATLDYIWSYLCQFMANIRIVDVENSLENYPHLFKLKCSGVGATYERKWVYIGFNA